MHSIEFTQNDLWALHKMVQSTLNVSTLLSEEKPPLELRRLERRLSNAILEMQANAAK